MKYGLIDRLKVVLHIILTSDDLTDFKVYEVSVGLICCLLFFQFREIFKIKRRSSNL